MELDTVTNVIDLPVRSNRARLVATAAVIAGAVIGLALVARMSNDDETTENTENA